MLWGVWRASFGHIKLSIFYLVCGVAATFAQLAFSSGSNVPNWASGAVAGVLGAYILMFPKGKVNVLMENIHPIRTEIDYEQALAEIADLVEIDPAMDTAEGERLELLSLVVKDYEEKHYPIPTPDDPVAVILFYMEKDGLTRKDMEAYLGNKARVSDVLNRRRSLSPSMIRRLNQGLRIPAELLLAPGRLTSQEQLVGAQVFPNP